MSIQLFGVVPFHKTEIPFIIVGDKKYIAIKPICDAIGLNYAYASTSIKSQGTLSKHYLLQKMEGRDGKMYDMGCLPLMRLPAWLSNIDTNKVSDKARPVLEAFQEQCFDVLYAHFFGAQEVHIRSKEVYLELHEKRTRLKNVQKRQADSEDGQEVAMLKKEIRTLEVEQASLDHERYGDQLQLV